VDVSSTRTELIQRGARLEYFTIIWNSMEGLEPEATSMKLSSPKPTNAMLPQL
jgi:hypothetical protein